MKKYKILSINPGSGSTKVALYENENLIFQENIYHEQSDLKKFETISDELPYRTEKVLEALKVHINSFMEGFEVLDNVKYTFLSFAMSMVIWGLEVYVAYLILSSFNLGLGFAAALFVISLISFSTMIPSTSVFLGPYQYAYILALGIFGVDKSITLAISTIHQALLIVILTIIGVFYLLVFNIEMKNKEVEKSVPNVV